MPNILRILAILGIIDGIVASLLAYRRRLDLANEDAMSEHVRQAIEQTRQWREQPAAPPSS